MNNGELIRLVVRQSLVLAQFNRDLARRCVHTAHGHFAKLSHHEVLKVKFCCLFLNSRSVVSIAIPKFKNVKVKLSKKSSCVNLYLVYRHEKTDLHLADWRHIQLAGYPTC